MSILAITQARIGSTRFPEKILKTVQGQSLLWIHLSRILKSQKITQLKVASTNENGVDRIISIAKTLGVSTFQGSTENVLERFYGAAQPEEPDWIVRLTSDCPLIDANVIDEVIDFAINGDLDYASNTLKSTYPDGLDVEVFKYSALEMAYRNAKLKSECEHVTPYIWKNSTYFGGTLFKSGVVLNDTDYSRYRITVDTEDDLEVIKALVEQIGIDGDWDEYISILEKRSEVFSMNRRHKRNEGYQKSLDGEKE
jgi:spore coat polysaccharide biosynthesis protein SpsF